MSDFDVVTGEGTRLLPEKVRAELAARQVPLAPAGPSPGAPPALPKSEKTQE